MVAEDLSWVVGKDMMQVVTQALVSKTGFPSMSKKGHISVFVLENLLP